VHLVKLLDEFAQAEVVLAVVDFPEFNNSRAVQKYRHTETV